MSAIFWTLSSCTCNTILTEIFTKSADGSSSSFTLLTFATFLMMTLDGLFRHPEYLWCRHIPMRCYLQIVFIFFLVSLANNWVFGFDAVPFPLIIVFRSGTLVANVLLTWFLQNRRYSRGRIVSVLLVTAGIVLFTLSSERRSEKRAASFPMDGGYYHFFIGVTLMSAAMFASAYLGILQEKLFMLYGKWPEEMAFYVHLLSLPLFLFVSSQIKSDFQRNWSTHQLRPIAGLPIPVGLVLMLSSLILQVLCVRSVYQLSSQMGSLQLTMVLTLRKFLSILFSVLIFNNDFGFPQMLSTAMILTGSFSFYDGFTKSWHWLIGRGGGEEGGGRVKKKIL